MQNETQQTISEEITLKDIVEFLSRNIKLIALCGLVGALFLAAYVALTPKSYEARWQLQMAQFDDNSNSNSEEPAALIQRLRAPTVYPVEVRQSCGVHEDGDYSDYLDGVLKVEVVKNVPNAVEMKVHGSSPGLAVKCAEAVTAMIVMQQRGLVEERLAWRQEQLAEYQQALADEQQQLERIKKTELGNFGYLAKLDKLSWLRTRIDALQEEIMLLQLHPAKLLAPIYASSKPVSPKAILVLMLGALLGLMLGLLYALGRESRRKVSMRG